MEKKKLEFYNCIICGSKQDLQNPLGCTNCGCVGVIDSDIIECNSDAYFLHGSVCTYYKKLYKELVEINDCNWFVHEYRLLNANNMIATNEDGYFYGLIDKKDLSLEEFSKLRDLFQFYYKHIGIRAASWLAYLFKRVREKIPNGIEIHAYWEDIALKNRSSMYINKLVEEEFLEYCDFGRLIDNRLVDHIDMLMELNMEQKTTFSLFQIITVLCKEKGEEGFKQIANWILEWYSKNEEFYRIFWNHKIVFFEHFIDNLKNLLEYKKFNYLDEYEKISQLTSKMDMQLKDLKENK